MTGIDRGGERGPEISAFGLNPASADLEDNANTGIVL